MKKVKPEKHKIFKGKKLIIGRQTGVCYYQEDDFITTDGVLVLKEKTPVIKNAKIGLTFRSSLQKNLTQFCYSNTVSASKLSKIKISLPTKDGNIDFAFMEAFIAELEAQRVVELEVQRKTELEAYLAVTGLKDYTLTEEEEETLNSLDKVQWKEYRFADVFNNIQQGRRLKKEDQIEGSMPFVMAGVTNTGVVNYISNPVATFPKNSITIDIFGNAFYRNYDFGAGDDTGVYWNTERKLSREMMLFLTKTSEKALQGKFSYGKKLRSSQSLNLRMKLPTKNGTPDYDFMNTYITAIHKVVIKEVVLYAEKKIQATKEAIK